MTHLEKMAIPMTVTLADGDWDVVQGLVTKEWALVRDDISRSLEDRLPYFETLDDIRQTIIRRNNTKATK